jgi:hypothetical protein
MLSADKVKIGTEHLHVAMIVCWAGSEVVDVPDLQLARLEMERWSSEFCCLQSSKMPCIWPEISIFLGNQPRQEVKVCYLPYERRGWNMSDMISHKTSFWPWDSKSGDNLTSRKVAERRA